MVLKYISSTLHYAVRGEISHYFLNCNMFSVLINTKKTIIYNLNFVRTLNKLQFKRTFKKFIKTLKLMGESLNILSIGLSYKSLTYCLPKENNCYTVHCNQPLLYLCMKICIHVQLKYHLSLIFFLQKSQ